MVVHFLQVQAGISITQLSKSCSRRISSLFSLAFRYQTLNLIKATICARRTMLDHIAAHFAGAAALTCFGRSAFHSFGGTRAIGLEAGVGS